MRPSALLVTLALAAATVAGCGGGGSSPSAGSTLGNPLSSPGATPSGPPGGTSTPAPGSSTAPGGGTNAPRGHGGHPRKSTTPRTPPPRPTIAVSSGFKRSENYCALTPATGTLTYTPSGSRATVQLALGGLPANALLAIDWQTNDGNGYSIGSFQTDASGKSKQATLRMFRSPATAGDQVLITTSKGTQVAQLNHC